MPPFVWVGHMEPIPSVLDLGVGRTSPVSWLLASGLSGPSRPAVVTVVPGGEVLDHPSFTELYERVYDSMVRLAYVILGSADAAEEVVQDAFLALHDRFGQIDRPEWYLRRVVVNRCRDQVRRKVRFRQRVPLLVVDAVQSARSSGHDGERRDLVEALRTLPLRQRAAIVLRFFGDHSEAEIADALGVRPGTVKSLVHRGLEALRAELGEEVTS